MANNEPKATPRGRPATRKESVPDKADKPEDTTRQQPGSNLNEGENEGDKLNPKSVGRAKDQVKADQKFEKSALERKADALEEAGGDPAKVNELRHQAPAVRTEALKSTAEQSRGSAPTVRDAEEFARLRAEEAREVSEGDQATGQETPGRRLGATRNVAS